MKFIMGSDSTGSGDEHVGAALAAGHHSAAANVPVIHRPMATNSRPGRALIMSLFLSCCSAPLPDTITISVYKLSSCSTHANGVGMASNSNSH